MYKAFFQFERRPFEINPDPAFLYSTGPHREALAGLYYGIKAAKGFLALSGEVGTGKTLVVQCLRELLAKDGVACPVVFNPRLSSHQFLSFVAGVLGLSPSPSEKGDLCLELSRFLVERHRLGLTTVLVVEEAQLLSADVLEEIRLLTNLETPQVKLLQIVLVGQPELTATLDSPALRQLKQRITLWFRLRLLSDQETSHYVQRRLEVAGAKNGQIFTPLAIERVYRYSQGTPRLINTLCDNALMSAFALCETHVTPERIDEAALDLGLKRVNGNGHSPVTSVLESVGGEQEILAAVLERKALDTHIYTKSNRSIEEEST
jgi:type II secretory pathway predicted ATPase ExeA